ncbi:MAG: aroE [Proteobacteria bacterium]|nr:aroE [Pseudomonadota bacterium]
MTNRNRYVLFGHPVSHSWSPFIHGLFARQHGHEIDYQLVDVGPERFRGAALEFFAGGGRGANVTVPHKVAAAELANELTPRAQRAGAVNTLALLEGSRLLGDNTDGVGLIADLSRNLGMALQHRRVLILGAGGAVRGVLAPLLAERPATVLIANRTSERAIQLAAAFADLGPVRGAAFQEAVGQRWDLVINATSASLGGGVPDIPAGVVTPWSTCYDLSYSRHDTPFQHWARQQGAAQAYQGWGMLVEQAAEAYLLWRGVRPDTGPVLEALATL